jgi:hypothetical protein
MTKALYAHMNNIKKINKKKRIWNRRKIIQDKKYEISEGLDKRIISEHVGKLKQ